MRLIDADELIELINDDIASLDNSRIPQIAYNECLCTLRMVKQYIKALPTAEPRWIPTTERLPDVGVYVLVCTKQKSGQIIERIGVYSGTSYGWSTGGATRDVVAWMPLPKVYKGDEVKE